MKKIRVAIVGVGNCAKSLVQGVARYSKTKETIGLAHPAIGEYYAKDIEFCLAYDIDTRKVGRSLNDAIYAKPNCAIDLIDDKEDLKVCIPGKVNVKRGALYDGVPECSIKGNTDQCFSVSKDPEPSKEDIIRDLKNNEIDVLINYLPVGSEVATRFYIEACIEAKVPFVNCIPVFIVSDPYWQEKLIEAEIPAIGDDMKSLFGASILSQMLQELLFARGCTVDFHQQLNIGGNMDFKVMMDQTRLASKKISKENVIRAQNDIRNIPVKEDSLFAGPSTHIPYLGDNKVAYFNLRGSQFGGAHFDLDIKLSVQDSPNSAGVVIDAIRYVQVARELGMIGAIYGASAWTQKTPPKSLTFEDTQRECDLLAKREIPANYIKDSNTNKYFYRAS